MVESQPSLTAKDARRRLLDALEPVRALAGEAARGRCDPRALRFVVQLCPLLLQITLAPDEGRPARAIVTIPGRKLPDHGAALVNAVEAIAAAILSAMKPEDSRAVLLNAAAAGGLAVLVDPSDESATLFFAEPGKSLGEGVVLGALADAPELTH